MHLTMHLRVATRSIFKSSQNQAVGKAGKSKFDDPQTLFSGCFGCFAALASRRALRRCSYLARRRSAFASKYRRRPNAVDFPTSFYSFLSRVHSKMPPRIMQYPNQPLEKYKGGRICSYHPADSLSPENQIFPSGTETMLRFCAPNLSSST